MSGLVISSVVAAAVVSILGTAGASAQSLADVARREAERRARMGVASKVYTDHDLKPAPPGTPSIAIPQAPAVTTSKPGSATAEGSADGKASAQAEPPENFDDRDETYWRRRAEAIRSQLEAARADVVALDARAGSLDGAKGGAEARELEVVTAGQKRARTNIASLQAEWDRFEKTARAANVPLTWIR